MYCSLAKFGIRKQPTCIESSLTGQWWFPHSRIALWGHFPAVDLEIDKFFINSALIGVVSASVRKTCTHVCKSGASQEEAAFYTKVTVKNAYPNAGLKVVKCAMTGYKGRIASMKCFLLMSQSGYHFRGGSESEIENALNARGFISCYAMA